MRIFFASVVLGAVMLSGGQAHAIGEDIAKEAIREAGKTVRAAINKNKSEVEIESSTLNNKVKMERALSVGNSGIKVKGDKVSIKNSKIFNDVRMKEAVNVGNAGIEVGK